SPSCGKRATGSCRLAVNRLAGLCCRQRQDDSGPHGGKSMKGAMIAAVILLLALVPRLPASDDLLLRTALEEAPFRTALTHFLQGRLPQAAEAYARLLREFPSGPRREVAVLHLFVCADHWLEDTREEMQQVRERREGERAFVWRCPFHWD